MKTTLLTICLIFSFPTFAQTFTNLGFNGDTFPGGIAPGWTAQLDGGVSASRRTGAQYEEGVCQQATASSGWDQKALFRQTGTVTTGRRYRVTGTAGFIPGSNGTRWDSFLGAANGSTNTWEDVDATATFWGYGNTTTQNSVQFEITAMSDTMTIMVRLNFSWGTAWVDNLTISDIGGATIPPTPTFTLTPTQRATLTPTPTIPLDLGSSVLNNGNFEGGFTGGIATHWNGFSLRAGGYTKESALLGRNGGGIYGYSHGAEDDLNVRMAGKTYLVDLSRFDLISRLRNELGDDVLTVAKTDAESLFDGGNPYSNPEANGRIMADWWYNRSQRDGHWGHAYYGVNEPDMNLLANLRLAARFDLAYTRRLHELGLRSVVINNAFGTPENLENMLIPEVRDLLAEADYVGYHPYAHPAYVQMCAPEGYHITLRWRQIAQMYEERGWRYPPIIFTEGGDHGIEPDGFPNPIQVRDDLICWEGLMRQDRWCVGMNYFLTATWGGLGRFRSDPLSRHHRGHPRE